MQVFNTDLGTALQYFVALFWPFNKGPAPSLLQSKEATTTGDH